MTGDVVKFNFRKAAPETEKPAPFGRFQTEAEAREWWRKHDEENPFGVILRERFRLHREMFYRKAAGIRARVQESSPQERPSLWQILRYMVGAADSISP